MKATLILTLPILWFAACAGAGDVRETRQSNIRETEYSADSLTLDAAIAEAAGYFTRRLAENARVALVHFDAPTGRLADYVFEEMWNRIEDAGKFIMVDRRNLERIEAEINHQYKTGRVDDNLLASMTRQYGAEILVHGQISSLGQGASAPGTSVSEFRMTVYATDVERAASSQRAFTIRPDSRLSSLLNASAEDEVERAVAALARSVEQRTTIAIGRISFAETQSVSGFSAWLKNSIIASAQKQQGKFQVATENESQEFAVASRGGIAETPVPGNPVQAVVTGNFSPLDSGAEVSLQLISTGSNRVVLSSARFVIPASELERRNLSLLPGHGNTAISLAEFETRQQAVDPYSGRNNRWIFSVTPDVLDGIFYEGDYMTMRVYSEQDCYFRIIHVDVHGNTQVIYPVNPGNNNRIRAGETRCIPDYTDNIRFRMARPFGEEMILVAGYDRPFTASQSGGSGTLSADAIARGIMVESDNRTSMGPSVTAKFSYTILPRR